jgi:hypothetical protein
MITMDSGMVKLDLGCAIALPAAAFASHPAKPRVNLGNREGTHGKQDDHHDRRVCPSSSDSRVEGVGDFGAPG